MKDLKQLEEQYKLLGEEIEKLKSKEQEPWPKVGDIYWCADSGGTVFESGWDDLPVDEYRLSTNNCHYTQEQVLRHKEYVTSPRVRARELVEMCEGFDPRGGYEVYARSNGNGRLFVGEIMDIYGGIAFSSKEFRSKAIEDKEDLIKVALGVIVGEEAERIVREYVGRGE